MSLALVEALARFSITCVLLVLAEPGILIVIEACVHWASPGNVDSFIDSLKLSAEAFWDSFVDVL